MFYILKSTYLYHSRGYFFLNNNFFFSMPKEPNKLKLSRKFIFEIYCKNFIITASRKVSIRISKDGDSNLCMHDRCSLGVLFVFTLRKINL